MILSLVVCSLFFHTVSAAVSCSAETGPCIAGNCPGSDEVCYDSKACCSIMNLHSDATTTTTSPMTTAAVCVDKINPQTGMSDCPAMSNYCNVASYYDLMTQQCPQTCGRCGGGGGGVTTTAAPAPPPVTCVDQINPKTGYSDCPSMLNYCNDPNYYTLMTQQCPRSCGRC